MWAAPALLVAVSALVFAGTLGAGFTYDDRLIVLDNPSIRGWDLWQSWRWSARPVRTLSLMIDYHLFGTAPAGYHAHNLLWHTLSVLLFYAVVWRLSGRRLLSFAAALLFAVHPIHVEAIANVSNRKEMLCMAFSLGAVLSYCRFVDGSGRRRWPWLAASAICWWLALYAKQVAVALPLSVVSYELLFLPVEKRFLTRRPYLLGAALALGAVLLLGFVALRLDLENLEGIRTFSGYAGDASLYSVALTSARAFWKYVGLLLWPSGLCPDHLVELSDSIGDPTTAFAWLGLAGFAGAVLLIGRRAPLLSFGLFWMLTHYLPVSNLVPSVFVLADRYMYIASAGFCLASVAVGDWSYQQLSRRNAALALGTTSMAVLALSVAYAARSVAYIAPWKAERSLWEYTLQCNPRSARAHNGLGFLDSQADAHEAALRRFTTAVALNARLPGPHWNRASTLYRLGRSKEALREFDRALERWPGDAEAYYNRAQVHAALGDDVRAIEDYTRAIKRDRDLFQAYNNRANAYARRGELDRALADYERAIALQPDSAEAHFNLANCHRLRGEMAQALRSYTAAAMLGSKRSQDLLRRLGRESRARQAGQDG